MKTLIHVAFCMVLAQLPSNATLAQEAPFGLIWGLSSADALKKGLELKETTGSNFGKTFSATKVEQAVADQESLFLSFGYDDKLWRIIVVSRDFKNDPSGHAVKARYRELSRILSEKYSRPTEFHLLGDSIYAEPQYFVYGIREGQNNWHSNFDTATLRIQLDIKATDSSTSYWSVIYEYKPLLHAFEEARRSKEKGSF